MEARTVADTDIEQIKAPLLLLYAMDDLFWIGRLREGQHDGGSMSLAYRDRVATHLNVRTLLVDRGNHAGMLYLSDPHWFGLAVLNYLKYWQARDMAQVTTAVPQLDILAEEPWFTSRTSGHHIRAALPSICCYRLAFVRMTHRF
jgi:hypothetical protein